MNTFSNMVDDRFDLDLSAELQLHAPTHFTPIAVARRAARLLAPRPGMKVLDVGAGIGKFCVVAACEVPTATFVGVELRPHLVHVARRLALRYSVLNAQFIAIDAFDVDWTAFDAVYLYNPFAEHLFNGAFALDRTLTLEPNLYVDLVQATYERLERMPMRTRLVTYHGFGVVPPTQYELMTVDVQDSGHLELWIKCRD